MSKFYDLREWRDVIRRRQLAQHPLCHHCAARAIVKAATEVDHIVPMSEGGDPRDPANLQSLCMSCHSRKTAADNGKSVTLGCGTDGVPLARRQRAGGEGAAQTFDLRRDERRNSFTCTSAKPDRHDTA